MPAFTRNRNCLGVEFRMLLAHDMSGFFIIRQQCFQINLLDEAPFVDALTDYDRTHLITYLGLLDIVADKTPWREAAAIILGIHAEDDEKRARRAYDTHLARAHWMSKKGHASLLRS